MPKKPTAQSKAQQIADERENPLLVLYWPDEGMISEEDVPALREFLRKEGLSRKNKGRHLDILIETIGGETGAPYLIGQMLHDYAENIIFLVPNKSLSAGTQLCLAGHSILMGEDALLSPIDTQFTDEEGRKWSETWVEKLRELADGAQNEATQSAIIQSTLSEVDVHLIAEAYSQSRAIGAHARKLLDQHMLRGADNEQLDGIIAELVYNSPGHDWEIDYEIAVDIGLKVERMGEALSQDTKELAKILKDKTAKGTREDDESGSVPCFMYVKLSENE